MDAMQALMKAQEEILAVKMEWVKACQVVASAVGDEVNEDVEAKACEMASVAVAYLEVA